MSRIATADRYNHLKITFKFKSRALRQRLLMFTISLQSLWFAMAANSASGCLCWKHLPALRLPSLCWVSFLLRPLCRVLPVTQPCCKLPCTEHKHSGSWKPCMEHAVNLEDCGRDQQCWSSQDLEILAFRKGTVCWHELWILGRSKPGFLTSACFHQKLSFCWMGWSHPEVIFWSICNLVTKRWNCSYYLTENQFCPPTAIACHSSCNLIKPCFALLTPALPKSSAGEGVCVSNVAGILPPAAEVTSEHFWVSTGPLG